LAYPSFGVNFEKLTQVQFVFGDHQQQRRLYVWEIGCEDLPGILELKGGAPGAAVGRGLLGLQEWGWVAVLEDWS